MEGTEASISPHGQGVPARRRNQHNPIPPLDEIRDIIEEAFLEGRNDPEILSIVKHVYLRNHPEYGLSLTTLKRLRKTWGLLSTRQQNHTLESAEAAIDEVRHRFPTIGIREMVRNVFNDSRGQVKLPRRILSQYFHLKEPQQIATRRRRRIRRKVFYSAGVNDLWCFDQHDKWVRFGLFLHVGLEPFSGMILWLKIWWTNSNPRLICKFYLDTAIHLGQLPLVTQSDLGAENWHIAYAHSTLRQMLDPNLAGTIQHRWRRKAKNVKPEIAWKELRQRWSPGFEDVLQKGLNDDVFHREVHDEVMVFRFVFIPWLQAELDQWVEGFNKAKKRYDRKKVTPQGRPKEIFQLPTIHGAKNYGINIDPEHIEQVRETYAPPDHPVFDLLPPVWGDLIGLCYDAIGKPEVTFHTCWDVYHELLTAVRHYFSQLDEPTLSGANGAAANAIALEDAEPETEMPTPDFAGYEGSSSHDQV